MPVFARDQALRPCTCSASTATKLYIPRGCAFILNMAFKVDKMHVFHNTLLEFNVEYQEGLLGFQPQALTKMTFSKMRKIRMETMIREDEARK